MILDTNYRSNESHHLGPYKFTLWFIHFTVFQNQDSLGPQTKFKHLHYNKETWKYREKLLSTSFTN